MTNLKIIKLYLNDLRTWWKWRPRLLYRFKKEIHWEGHMVCSSEWITVMIEDKK